MPKKQKYRLAPLLTLKERQKRKAEIALARAIKELDEEKKKLEKLHQLKADLIRRRKQVQADMSQKVASGQSLVQESQYRLGFMQKLKEDEEALDKEISEQKEAVETAGDKFKRAKRDYIDSATELNVMEKHKDLWLRKEARALTALDNKRMNELGQIVHQINKLR